MSKRGQSQANSAYVLLVVVLVAIIVVGFESIVSLNKTAEKARAAAFNTKLSSDAKMVSQEFGSVRKFNYIISGSYKEVCFLDYNADPEGIGSVKLRLYPRIRNSYFSGTGQNVFLVGETITGYTVDSLQLGVNTTFVCLPINNGRLDVSLIGTRDGALLQTLNRVSIVLSAGNPALLNFNDEVKLNIPAGALDANTEVTLEEAPLPPGANPVTPAYKIGPSGPLNFPVTVTLSYNPSLLNTDVCPPPQDILRFMHFDDAGHFIESLPYNDGSVDCVAHTAQFTLTSFSIFYLGAAQSNNGGQPPVNNTPINNTPINNQVSLEDFENVLLKASANYLFGGTLATEVEIKDLFTLRSATQGTLVDLSGKGQFSQEKLVDIYNKLNS